ncbi:flagellar hook-associated protein FlgL [Frateuria terrea]|uniref:Flagellar hook-associated protein 3 FlgL n=1 Tax=Frateuria terrea TaxID=529704 RepID=A0A1H6VTP3_9GAMM|nr:flagellar hook-associated protein FlgL [Frateuria terrea]SEJ08048.1 flagellar hook-associated protein 3 FlgL [Frateuria terrea]SFP69233.1 flagellar hook-associated protein 3 FlgL [Frateuria terrea]
MRVSTSWMQQQSVNTMMERQGDLSDIQTQMGTGKRINQPSDDPVGAARAVELTHLGADTAQYQRNITSANARLGLEDQTLSSVTNVLARVRTLLLEGMNATQTDESRSDIAAEMVQLRGQLLGMANSKDSQGDYIFAGNRTGAAPFQAQPGGVSYVGDDGQRMVAAGPGLQVATGDPGSAIFMAVPNGNGVFAVGAAAANVGSAVAGANSVTDASVWDGGTYQITFTAADAYEIRDGGGVLVASGAYDAQKGGAVPFKGVQVAFSGAPAAGDKFTVAPSSNQDVFATLDGIIGTLSQTNGGGAAMQNALNGQLSNLDQAIGSVSQARAGVGARMNALDQQSSLNDDLTLQYKTALSDVQDLDYYDAVSRLSLQSSSLQAAQLTFSKLQNMSLFDYLR